MPERYALDAAALEAAYRRVQAAVHPDRHAAGTEHERRISMQLATQANEAYRTLRDPMRRAAYLCERAGAPIEAESNTAMPPEFLMQQLEWREELDEARGARDLAALERLRETLREARGAMLQAIGRALDEQHDAQDAAKLVRRLMFLDKLGSEIDAAEEAMIG